GDVGGLVAGQGGRGRVGGGGEAARKDVAVHLIVFDQQNFWHRLTRCLLVQLAMRSASWTGCFARRPRTAAASSIRYDGFLAMIRSACPLRTPKSSAVSSFAVSTMTRMPAKSGLVRS